MNEPPSRRRPPVGRATSLAPPNRFETTHLEDDFEQTPPDEDHDRRRVPTEFLPDRSRSIICENDHLAARLQRDLMSNGYKLPETVSIFGFDNDTYSSENNISTVEVDRQNIGKRGAETILWRISQPDADVVSIDLSTRLIHRDSVKSIG